jgi:hypothetical protein
MLYLGCVESSTLEDNIKIDLKEIGAEEKISNY